MPQNRTRIRIKQPRKTPKERYQLVTKVEKYQEYNPDMSLNNLCESYGVSPSNYRRWKGILDDHPEYRQQGIIPVQSTCPEHFARQTSEAIKQRVVEESDKPHHTSASSITKQLNDEGIAIGKGKVIEILEEAGRYGTIHRTNAKGEHRQQRGLLRLCEKRQQQP